MDGSTYAGQAHGLAETPGIPSDIRAHLEHYPKRLYPKGQIILFADEVPGYVYYLTEGRVRAYDVSYRGEEVVVNVCKPPAYFPLSWALNLTPNKFFYKAEVDSTIHLVPVQEFVSYLLAHPKVMLEHLSKVYRGIDGVFGRIVHLMSGTAKSRLIYELLVECKRFGKLQANGDRVIHLNESDLAARTGLTRETVSREMKMLKERQWVALRNHAIIIKSIAGLETELQTIAPY